MFKRLIFSFLLVLSLTIPAQAIVPFLFPVVASGARILVGQFAAAGVATVINPTTSKTLKIPASNKALKVSFGIASNLAALALFATASNYTDSSSVTCQGWVGMAPGSTAADVITMFQAAWRPAGNTLKVTDLKIGFVNSSGAWNFDWRTCAVAGAPVVTPAADVMWSDLSSNLTQAKTDKTVSDLKAFAISNPSDFDQIASMTGTASVLQSSNFAGVDAPVEVKADGQMYYNGVIQNGATWTDSSGVSHSSSVNESGQLLVDGALPTGFTASNPTNPIVPTADTIAPTGNTAATSGNTGSIVESVNGAKQQGIKDSSFIAGAINDLQKSNELKKTDCDKFPNSAGCTDLGAAPASPAIADDVHDFSTFALTPFQLLPAVGMCPPPPTFTIKGISYPVDNQPICNFMSYMRPVLIAGAWFTSIMIFVGAFRSGSV